MATHGAQPRLRPARLVGRLTAGAAAAAVTLAALAGLAAVGAVLALHLGMQPVLSGSMRPAYAPGDAIVTRRIPVRALRPGMIAVIIPPGHVAPYAHRVVSVTGDPAAPIITTKGDANPVADPWHARLTAATVPTVIAVVPKLGYLLVWLHRPAVLAALIAAFGLTFTVALTRWALEDPARRKETRPCLATLPATPPAPRTGQPDALAGPSPVSPR